MHSEGLYLYSDAAHMNEVARRLFAPSVPPPKILAAYHRCQRHGRSSVDAKIWVGFHESHTKPFLAMPCNGWTSPVPFEELDLYLATNSSMKVPRSRTTETRNTSETHPFGFSNPPEGIWEPFGRLSLGKEMREDQEIMDAYLITNEYCAEGTGLEEITVPKINKVRRAAKKSSQK